MNSHYITYQHSVIHYRYSGEGPESVICFHGFGTFARTFDWLAAHVPEHRFIAFDLPCHGDTQWNDGNTFTPEQLLEIIDLCPHLSSDRFSLLGYSMGGRVSLHLLQLAPHRVSELILLAPDGLHQNPWYWFSTQTALGNRFFKYVMTKPDRFVTTLHRASKYNLVNKGILKFVERYMEDRHVRELVYTVWTMFRRFKPNLTRIANEINRRNIPVVLIYGKYDSIIPLAPGEQFFHRITGRKRMEILETGHQILHVRNAPYIADAFNLL
jgi:pimeloyl-ACP methyl ester carboxylesterase